MSDLLQLLEIIAVGALLLIVFAVLSDPFAFLGAAFEAWNAKSAHDQAADSELARKCAIADAAIAARARGESFTPPPTTTAEPHAPPAAQKSFSYSIPFVA